LSREALEHVGPVRFELVAAVRIELVAGVRLEHDGAVRGAVFLVPSVSAAAFLRTPAGKHTMFIVRFEAPLF